VPAHLQQQQQQPLPATPAHYSGYGSYGETLAGATKLSRPQLNDEEEEGKEREKDEDRHRALSQRGGAASPPDFMPGLQSNVYQDYGGERPQGQVLDGGDPFIPFRVSSQAAQMSSYQYQYQYRAPPRAQDFSNQYYYGGGVGVGPGSMGSGYNGYNDNDNDNDVYLEKTRAQYQQNSALQNSMSMVMVDGGKYGDKPRAHTQMTTVMMRDHRDDTSGPVRFGSGYSYGYNVGGPSGNNHPRVQQRSRIIGFTDTIEIIPVYRKSEYNRRSDKHATFKNLTPDLKCEIRDELNTYKMREMAVHVESMGNTAFH